MSANIYNILAKIEEFAPPEIAEEWDNVGYIIQRENQNIKKILLALEINNLAVKKALKDNIDLIITHHPPIFDPLKKIENNHILKLIKGEVAVISAHTNLDYTSRGVSFSFAKAIGFDEISPITDERGRKVAVLGINKNLSAKEFSKKAKHKLNAPFVKLYSAGKNMDDIVKRVALCGGSGGDLIDIVKKIADIYISSDFKYHQIISSPIPLLDVGHLYSELPSLQIFVSLLKNFDVEIFEMKITNYEINNLKII